LRRGDTGEDVYGNANGMREVEIEDHPESPIQVARSRAAINDDTLF